ncbi:hypothetical protein WOLCODRAFT_143034 [Wolfiporia cocos MD-104 SS10]|uniref:F-box domain-containing protein n=1 Tax=Wolfiporia cocos (strain MD-104) TaxID=742152 RepID=A0A2H3JVZ5_WOLCO|nr:hypothetical protein WOLCODRAFT_143034 [Wolfiporia cocos MD-104 SS10]
MVLNQRGPYHVSGTAFHKAQTLGYPSTPSAAGSTYPESPQLSYLPTSSLTGTQPVPTLQMLDLQIVEPKILIHTDLHTAMMPQLFDGQMPHLSRLHLTGSYPWLCKFGPNLTHLRIDNSLTTLQTSTTAFLDFLESCPKLVELILHIAGPCAEVDMHSSPRSVSLPELTNLRLHNVPCDTGACALRHLHLPAVSTICLTDIIGLTSADDLVYIADANSLNICNSLADPRSLSLWVIDNMFTIACGDDTSDEASQVRLHFSTDTETYDDQHQEDPDPFALNLVLPKEEIIHALPQMLVVSNVTTLHLFRLHPLDSKDILLHLIDAMPSVERFAFFLSEIQAERDYWHSCLSCKNVTTFPCLRTLHILEGFRPHREWKPTWIFALALSRAKHGRRLGTLRSTMVGVPPDQSNQHTKWNSLAHRFQGKKVKGFVNEMLFDTDPDDPTELLEPAPLFDCE